MASLTSAAEFARRSQVDLANGLLGLTLNGNQATQNTDATANPQSTQDFALPSVVIAFRALATNAEHHELYLEFPALDLLPNDMNSYLEDPANIQYREQPASKAFDMNDPDALVYATYLETFGDISSAKIPEFHVYGQSASALVDSIERLASAPGISKLKVVAGRKNGHIVYLARLSTNWITAAHEYSELRDFVLGGSSWISILEQRDGESWADLLLDLLRRSSDRAYFHVRRQLRAYNASLAIAEDARLAMRWNTATLSSPNQLLVDSLQWLGGRSHESSAVFPCGHKSHANAFYLLHHATELEAAELTCTTCGHYALTDLQYHRVMMWWDRCERAKFFLDAECWAGLETTMLDPQNRFQVTYDELTTSVDEVLSTLETPESIDPFGLCPTTYRETATVQMHFYEILRDDSGSFSVSLEDGPAAFFSSAINSLRRSHRLQPQDDLDTALPVGYIHFLRRWIHRVFVLLATRAQKKDNELVESLMEMMLSGKDEDQKGSRKRGRK
ncbi:hypothetical protein AC578_4247 [Pseudocercospora eumusae]|uniref:Uncharacterized protein n=1 Tax=Pseudocercospora eumusae TaxID=321146 RepID=A0A139HAQ6_9PEZI|nr:hypothetical protein AC578_4247 [Pseudocercospora eumusae]